MEADMDAMEEKTEKMLAEHRAYLRGNFRFMVFFLVVMAGVFLALLSFILRGAIPPAG